MNKVLAAVLSLVLCFALSTNVWAGSDSVTVKSVDGYTIKVYAPSDSYLPPDDPAWEDQDKAELTWVHGSWPALEDAKWISSSFYVEDPVEDSWRWFHHEFTIPCTAYNVDEVVDLSATSDNAEEVYFNGAYVGSDGEVQGPFVDDREWSTIIDYPIYPQPGTNALDFIVRNYGMTQGTPTSNPTGLIYKATINYEIPDVAWLPPVTHQPFTLKNGTTLPLKLQLIQQDGALIMERKDVVLELWEGECGSIGGARIASWELGAGVENLRFDEYEYYYIANFKTKDFDNLGEDFYHTVVRDGCDGSFIIREACIQFEISSAKGTNRGNSKK